MTTALALRGGERISHRHVLHPDDIDSARFNLLTATLIGLRTSVREVTAGRPVLSRLVYLTYEEVVDDGGPGFVEPGDDDLPFYGGEAA